MVAVSEEPPVRKLTGVPRRPKRVFVGPPTCRYCDVELDQTNWYPYAKKASHYACKQCTIRATTEYKEKDPAHRAIRKERYRKKLAAMSPEELLAHRRKVKNKILLKDHKISLDVFEEMQKAQNYCCSICGRSRNELTGELHVDHNHTTGKVRSLLCVNCNIGVGMFKESADILKKAIIYLESHGEISE